MQAIAIPAEQAAPLPHTAPRACPNCGTGVLQSFYTSDHAVPVHSVLLMDTRDEALTYPKGEIELGFCQDCGFVSNLRFRPEVHEYSTRYEETQGYSPTFNAFHRRLAQSLIEKYGLRGKSILEIGCGKGEFLLLLCELGGNRGVGFDPGYIDGRLSIPESVDIRFIQDFYSEKYSSYTADFVCCKMTLEHIQQTAEFVGTVRRALDGQSGAIVFFQVPDADRVLRDPAFLDVYYEHCSYFTAGSLAYLFQASGFDVLDVEREYDGQYLTVVARIGQTKPVTPPGPAEVAELANSFATRCNEITQHWRGRIAANHDAGGRTVLWGGGSKAVAFLGAVDRDRRIDYVVDINPRRQGTFIAGSGQQIVSPEFLKTYQPSLVIIMNPVYRQEIQASLTAMGLAPAVEAA